MRLTGFTERACASSDLLPLSCAIFTAGAYSRAVCTESPIGWMPRYEDLDWRGLALVLRSFNVAFLIALAFAVAASANVPAILLTLFWRRFNTTGMVVGMP